MPTIADKNLFENDTSALAVVPPAAHEPLPAEVTDLRHAMMSLPVVHQEQMLAEFKERRDFFRDWLLRQLRQGLHYGVPPGCEPKYDEQGNVVYKGKVVPKEQWTHKPTLYAAGADFICELMGLRDTYEADMESWEQLGKPVMTYVRKCSLWSRKTGELLGEGTGARKTSENDGSVNDALKMADKSAKIAAVMNAYGLRDLFVQPEDKEPPPRHENPSQQSGAPRTATRGERKHTGSSEFLELGRRWKEGRPAEFCNKDEWASYCFRATGQTFDYSDPKQWNAERLKLLRAAIEKGSSSGS